MIRCSEKRNGKLLKVPCKKRPLFLRSEKPVLHRMIFDLSSLVTCSHRPLLLPLVLQKWEFHSSVCMVPALQWENHSLLELSPYLPDMGITFSVPPPAILPLPKKNFVFLLVTVVSALFPLPGLLPEVLPVFSVQRPLIHQKWSVLHFSEVPSDLWRSPESPQEKSLILAFVILSTWVAVWLLPHVTPFTGILRTSGVL